MKKVLPLQFLKYLFWLGLMLVIVGLSAGVTAGSWGAVPLGLIAIGLVISIAGLFQQRGTIAGTSSNFLGQRSTQVRTNALLTAFGLLIILGLLNFLATRNVARLDLTENQVFTLAPETKQIVRNLPQPVKVWVFTAPGNSQDRELLENYRRLDDRVSYEFVDPQQQPTTAQRLEVKNIGDVIVEFPAKDRKQFVQTVLPANTENPVAAAERLSESRLTNALEQITSDRRKTVYFTQGHGEHAFQAGQGAVAEAIKLLNEKNLTSKPLVLAEAKAVPKDADVVVVAGPQKPFLPAEVKTLSDYLTKGGNVLLMVNPTETQLGLESLLKDWGIDLDKRVVIDSSTQGVGNLGPADAIVSQYGDHPITKELQGNLSFYRLSRPLGIAQAKDVTTTPLLYTSDRSWAETNLKSDPLQFDQGQDQQGPLVLGAALTRPTNQSVVSPSPTPSPSASPSPPSSSPSPSPSPTPSLETTQQNAPKSEARLVVIGNSTFATDGYFNQVVNGDVFLNSVRWLSKEDQKALSVRAKEPKNRRLNLSPQQGNLAGWLALVILPILGFGSAFLVWWKRR